VYLDTSAVKRSRRRFIARLAKGTHGNKRGISGSGVGGLEVREEGIELGRQLRNTISELSSSDGGIRRITQAQVKMAEFAHYYSEGDIDNIISRSSTVRETSVITSNNSERILRGSGGDRGGKIESQHFGWDLVGDGRLVDSR
jgi:hypothetical protein